MDYAVYYLAVADGVLPEQRPKELRAEMRRSWVGGGRGKASKGLEETGRNVLGLLEN